MKDGEKKFHFKEELARCTKEYFDEFKASERFNLKPYILIKGNRDSMLRAMDVINEGGKRRAEPLMSEFTLMFAPITSNN